MIELDGVAARRPPLVLSNVSLAWGPGVHAVVGAPSDGGPLLLAVVAGAARTRAGRVRVLDHSPSAAAVRPRVALVPREPSLPDAMKVGDIFAVAAAIRGEPPRCIERLGVFGLERLAARHATTLSYEEIRAVAIAEAVTSSVVTVLLIEEPLVAVDPRAGARLGEALRARSRDGAAVVVTTASLRDAVELADDHVLLKSGAVVGHAASLDALAGLSPRGARMRMLVSDPRPLAAALAREEDVEAVARRNAAVVARGRDAVQLARAAGRAIVASGVDVIEMRIEAPTLDEARTAFLAPDRPR